MWQQIIVAIVLYAISYALTPRPDPPKDAVAGKLDVPHPPMGDEIPVVFGRVWVKEAGVIYYGNKKQKEIMSEGGGKK